ncbi:MAG: B12-binding domain-containing radical SAM protein [Deltaproteobacteria bacterium]|nr:MAG: B12-binding domain-containing radical SAM protein [Deltaproteobacteria bacterium]
MKIAPKLDERYQINAPKPNYALLINPFYRKDPRASFGKHVLTPTLALTSIAAATPLNWEIHYWDENLLQGHPPCEPFPSVVGITVHLTFAERAYELARWYRNRGAKVVMGGLHVMSCPDEVAQHADAIAMGEGVQLWPRILRDAEAGCLKQRYVGDFSQPYNLESAPRRELLPRESFLTTLSLIATRGCHNRCGFCYMSTKGLKMPYQMREPEQIATEFRQSDEPYGVFTDNNLGSNRDYLRGLCQELRKVDKIWSAAVTIDVTDDVSLVREMALSGCTGVFVGLESLIGENLIDARKKTPRPDDYARRVDVFHSQGIQVNTSFVFGFDHDTPDVFEKTVNWIEDSRLACATFHILTPYPGTPLFRKLEKEKRILHRDWNRYDTANVVFQPRKMTPDELQSGYEWCYRKLFSMRSSLRRCPRRIEDILPYLAMSILYKRSNYLWSLLIQHRLTHRLWHPFVERTRQRHLRFRKRLEQKELVLRPITPVNPGV